MNAIFIVLIPKVEGAEELKDFRPISLINSSFKILAKVLALRLREVLSSVISPTHGAFAKERQILDGAFVAQEAIHSRHRAKLPGLIIKLDWEKAYDHVDWSILDENLPRVAFGSQWRAWIKGCISGPNFSILINGSPKDFFPSSRRLRQGHPDLFPPFCLQLWLKSSVGLSLVFTRTACSQDSKSAIQDR
ncbi:uncharacterized protein LOC110008460 [Amborella trichopoda]|uniref:uncharacterized protein LOC110008460 n=1 Tax=Amborella trichopoda TaxID=13333 RepID=UPI0009BE798B|nr:uncharacterized protein LOC110008460 [Amborella trichopoda]|eukprot:XP_020531630.1 uncharacterized protein LOC110008460 [Amborella trichopoda]